MSYLQVVAAVIRDGDGQVLIALRPKDKHQGGLWEFPGGKVDAGETAEAALSRELQEELGIEVLQAAPLITVRHQYPDLAVALDVWQVGAFSGVARGREGQQIMWLPADKLPDYAFPVANLPIISAARLPPYYLVTPEPTSPEPFLASLEQALARGVRLVQFRAKMLSEADYSALASEVLIRCRAVGASLLVNSASADLRTMEADGLHLTSNALMALTERPVGQEKWLAASCHNEQELRHAQDIGVDFAVLSPVLTTASHPEAQPIGWATVAALIEGVNMPVYVLGGMNASLLPMAQAHGAQGVAAIRGLWTT